MCTQPGQPTDRSPGPGHPARVVSSRTHAARRPSAPAVSLLTLLALGLACSENPVSPRFANGPALGVILVVVTSDGSHAAPDGYAVSLDGGTLHAVGNADTLAFRGLPPSQRAYTVRMHSIPAHCVLFDGGSHSVQIVPGRVETVHFRVTCMAPGTGALRARMTTPGVGQYSLRVGDGSVRFPLGGEVRFTDLDPGVHDLHVDIAQCPPNGDPPDRVTVLAAHISEVRLTAPCVLGRLIVHVMTTGSNFDPGGYLVQVVPESAGFYCYDCFGGAIGTSGSIQFDIPPGQYDIWLDGVSVNCTVAAPTLRTVTIESRTEARIGFAVTCV